MCLGGDSAVLSVIAIGVGFLVAGGLTPECLLPIDVSIGVGVGFGGARSHTTEPQPGQGQGHESRGRGGLGDRDTRRGRWTASEGDGREGGIRGEQRRTREGRDTNHKQHTGGEGSGVCVCDFFI